jgi:hypothetical protein
MRRGARVASTHDAIMVSVIMDWSMQGRGRLYQMKQGSFRALHSDEIIRISPYPKKRDGFLDLFGFEFSPGRLPIFAVVEIKTIAYPTLSAGQKQHLDYFLSIGVRAYVARETQAPEYELIEWDG